MTKDFVRYTLHPLWYYRVYEDVEYSTPFRPEKDLDNGVSVLKTDGTLICRVGFGWNGPTAIPKKWHTEGMIYGSLPHDALYGLMCDGLLSRSKESRKMADQVLRDAMKQAGCWSATAWMFYAGVQVKGRDYANPRSQNGFKEILVAP